MKKELKIDVELIKKNQKALLQSKLKEGEVAQPASSGLRRDKTRKDNKLAKSNSNNIFKNNLIPVEGHENLYRDPATNAIVNTSKGSAENAKAARNKRLVNDNKLKQLESNITTLTNEINELKEVINNINKKKKV